MSVESRKSKVEGRGKRLLVLWVSLVFAAIAVEADELDTPVGRIIYRPGRRDLAERAAQVMRQTIPRLSEKIGVALSRPPVVQLCATLSEYDRAVPYKLHPHTLGVAMYGHNRIVINCALVLDPLSNDFSATLRHELCHFAIAEAVTLGEQPVPLWFNEGVATWFSGRVNLRPPAVLPEMVAAGFIYPLDELTERFPASWQSMLLAYEQSEHAVEYLVEEHGDGVVRDIITGVARGASFDRSFSDAAGMSVSMFEVRWRKTLKADFPIWRTIERNFVLSLLVVMALLTVLVFFVHRWRGRRKLAEWDEEDRLYGH